ncbi:hypothetical protein [Nocardia sp. CA-120079]|uniref:hypothetical protein n=1 Tax=Nocardia sp. CA-120079 TaxID=3239974 RepID=UPI003D981082
MVADPVLLDDFLFTRTMEIAVHSDDLAVRVHILTLSFPPQVFEPVLDLLSQLAVVRHVRLTVLRALSRARRSGRLSRIKANGLIRRYC